MTGVVVQHIRAALNELGDADYQARVWTGQGAENEMSSFVECTARLFDDSGLGAALESGKAVYGPPIDGELMALGDLVTKIDPDLAPNELIGLPVMDLIRERASAILEEIEDKMNPSAR